MPASTAELFGRMPDGEKVYRVTLANDHLRVQVITFGAAIQSIEAPDRHGALANVVLGFATLADYVSRSPHFGAVPGRYAGRIARGRFQLDGIEHQLACNDGPNALHGGPEGFGKRAWTLAEYGPQHAVLTLNSPDGDGGYPGALDVRVRYEVLGSELQIHYHAETSRPTVLNLTNHSYFNLAGEGSGTVLEHALTIEADQFMPIDGDTIPTGEFRSVAQTPFDFRVARPIGAGIRVADPQIVRARGYDHTYVLRGAGLRRAAVLSDHRSGRELQVLTTEPALQLYTGNMLTGSLCGPSMRAYRQSDAVCLEAQHAPDSPNQPALPSTVLRPGDPFDSTTVFQFCATSD